MRGGTPLSGREGHPAERVGESRWEPVPVGASLGGNFNPGVGVWTCMEIRDAVEADAERLASLTGAPTDVMRNLIHDRTVRVADDRVIDENVGADEDADEVEAFVSYDAQGSTVHVTQLEGDADLCRQLLDEPTRFAEREGMDVELLVAEDEETARTAAEAAAFEESGSGPRFGGTETTRYRWEPGG